MKVIVSIFLIFVLLFPLSAQEGQWQNFTAKLNVKNAVAVSGILYSVTSGGMLVYSNEEKSLTAFTTSEGLSSIDLTSVTVDYEENVWIGSMGGLLDRFNPVTQSWTTITDIQRSDFLQRDISSLLSFSDTLLVGTGFGVSVYSLSRNEFNDSYIKFGEFPTQTRVTSLLVDDTYIWIGTVRGIARGLKNDPLLSAPDRWETFSTNSGLPSEVINDIVYFNNTHYVATPEGVARFIGTGWQAIGSFEGIPVVSVTVSGNSLFAGSGLKVYEYQTDNTIRQVASDLPYQINSILNFDNEIYVLLEGGGIAKLNGDGWDYIIPDGPLTNILTTVGVDVNGDLWSGTASSGLFARGFSHYSSTKPEGERWDNYTVETHPEIRNNAYYRVFPASDGSVWVSSWGRGITRVYPDGGLTNFYLDDGLVGISTDQTFIVTGKAGEDNRGNIWFTSYDAANRAPLVKYNNNGEFEFFTNRRNPSVTILRDLIVDRNNTKWIISTDPMQRGLFYFNEEQSIGVDTDGWGYVGTQHGLPSANVTAVVEDLRGEIWVGTDAGLAIITTPTQPQASVRGVFILLDQYINSIAVDPLNRKWVGTQEGVFLITPDGVNLIVHYSTENTRNKLLADNILSVAFDEKSGIVYFGTERGISSLRTEAVAPEPRFTDLKAYPNPFYVPSEHSLRIEGLMRNSSIKVLSIDGKLVSSFRSPGGGVAFWDGRDDFGRITSSGVYIIVGISEDGTEVGKTKITVVRR